MRFWERHTFLTVLGVTLLLVAVAMLVPPEHIVEERYLPWQIEPVGESIEVFGLTLGETTLAETEQRFLESAEVTLFVRDGRHVVEAYFDSVTLAQIRAKVVVSLAFSATELEQIYQRGARIAKMGDGGHKVTLSGADVELSYRTPIDSITYMPRATLSPELVVRRFGEPIEQIEEPGVGQHWLYPDRGLDLLLTERGSAVLQYVAPSHFERLIAPLRALSAPSGE
ncbi:hypothetical protein D5085_11760 [Ectothiorhodospiraceae bacterium BW-2]|nr:hypothetical protein D5085_11760 [Ectothiorhodospiraceae bacterium BW-2]